MKRVIGKLVFVMMLALILGSISVLAQSPPPFEVKWQGVNAPMPEEVFWQAAAGYNGKIYAFGGNLNNDAEVKSTWIYDIANDEWSKGADMPTGRYLATAVEVGGKIYVMGGRQLIASAGPVDVNECYDPATNTWTTKTNMPNAIRGHAACLVNGKIYVLGGNTTAYQDAVSIYDPTANTWSSGAKMPFKAAYGGAAYLSSKGRIYYVGGVKSSNPSAGNFLKKSASYDPAANSWDATTLTMSDGTAYNTILGDEGTGKIFSFSGSYWDSTNARESAYPYNQVLDTSTGTWAYSADFPSPLGRPNGCGVALDGKMYLVGGSHFNSSIMKLVDVYDPASDEWYDPNPLFPAYYSYNPAVYAVNGKIYSIGGAWSSLGDKPWELDPSQPKATQKSSTANVPRYAGVSGLYDNTIILAEGSDADGNITGSAEIYDPLTDSFTAISGVDPTPTVYGAGAVVNGKLYVFGGVVDQVDSNKTRILDIASGTWSTGPDMPVALEQLAATALNGKIYIVGGYDGSSDNNVKDEIMIFDPSNSTFTQGPATPYPVLGHSLTTYGNYVVVDSGSTPFESDGTIYFHPSVWLQFFDTTSNTWSVYTRLYGKGGGGCAVIGNKFYSILGDDVEWPCNRVDIAQFGQGGCSLTCSASANPTSGQAPLTVNFTGNATATGCTGTPAYAWTFGDGGTSTEQSPSHIYQADGTYSWSLTVTAGDQSCRKSGSITVGGAAQCTVFCNATIAPSTGTAPLNVAFTGTVDAQNCTGNPAFEWVFGDGGTSTEQTGSHTYTTEGTFNWSYTVTVDGVSCSKTGTVTVGGIAAPTISSVSKMSSPFRLKIMGTGFAAGAVVKINGVNVPDQKVKSATQIVAKKGAALKNMCPKGTAVTITVTNTDGGVSNAYTYTRP